MYRITNADKTAKTSTVNIQNSSQEAEYEQIAVMCDHAMCGDRGIGECFGVELDLPGTIAKGDPTCQLRYVRRK